MLIHVENQEKLVELTEYLATLPIEVTHTFEGDTFPMVGDLRLDEAYDKTQIAVSFDGGETLMPAGEWEKKLEAELHAKFGNPLEMKGSKNVAV